MAASDEEMVAVRALRQSFETSGGPGSSVNSTGNPFFVVLTGQFDLYKAAQLVLNNIDVHRAHKQKLADEERERHLAAAAEELRRAGAAGGGAGDPA